MYALISKCIENNYCQKLDFQYNTIKWELKAHSVRNLIFSLNQSISTSWKIFFEESNMNTNLRYVQCIVLRALPVHPCTLTQNMHVFMYMYADM